MTYLRAPAQLAIRQRRTTLSRANITPARQLCAMIPGLLPGTMPSAALVARRARSRSTAALLPRERNGAAGQRRGDILVVWPDGGVRILDCVVTHPAAASYMRDAAEAGGSAAAKAEARKRADFEEVGEGSAFGFVPLAVESYGRMGVAASRFLSELGDLVETAGRVSKAAFVRTVRRELSCALCKRQLRACTTTPSRALLCMSYTTSGPGCDAPVEGPDDV